MTSMRRTVLVASLAALALTPGLCLAQTKEPLKFVLPFPPGGTLDTLTRALAGNLNAQGWTVVVENRPGANGFLAAQMVLQAPANGTTVLVTTPSVIASNVVLYSSMPYDPVKDFAPVARLYRSHAILLTGSGSAFKAMDDLKAAAKAGTEIKFSAGAPGHVIHFQSIRQSMPMNVVVARYRGTVDALRDVASGVSDLSIADPAAAYPLLESGRLRALAILGDRPDERLPAVPVSAEAGLGPTEIFWWSSVFVRAGTPADRIHALSEALRSAMQDQGVQETARRNSASPFWGDPATLRETQRKEIEMYRRHAAAAGVVAE